MAYFVVDPGGEGKLGPLVEYTDVWINYGEAMSLIDIARRDPVHAIARSMLRNALFSEELQAVIVKETLKSSPIKDLDLYFNLYYSPLGHAADNDCPPLGYTVWTYSEKEEERFGKDKVIVPVPVDRSRYDLVARMYQKDERVEWMIYKKGIAEPAVNCHVFMWPGMEPNPVTGQHNSIISALVGEHRKIQRLKEMEEYANIQRSHPSFVLEPVTSGGSGSATDLFIHTTTNPGGIMNAEHAQKQKFVNAMSEQLLIETMKPAMGVVRAPDGERVVVKGPRASFEESKQYLAHGYKGSSAQPALPEVPANVMEQEMTYNKLVFASYGIPFSLALGDGKTASSGGAKQTANLGGEKDMEMFQRTLLQATRAIEAFYTEVWYHSYPGTTSREDVRFAQGRVPFTSSGALYNLYNQGIIHGESLKKHLSQVHGLALHDIATEENVVTRPPMHGTENHVTAIIKAREEVLKAETLERLAKAKALKKDASGGEDAKELIELQIKFEKEKHEILKATLQAKLEYERGKIDIEKAKLGIEKERFVLEKKNKKQKTTT